MKLAINILIITILSFLAQFIFPWWSMAICAFVVTALSPSTGFKSFLSGLLGVGLLWLSAALYESITTDFILTEKIAALFKVGNSFIVIAITALLGGLVGGLSALSGNQLRQAFRNRRNYPKKYRSV